jgi:hypothetical protein
MIWCDLRSNGARGRYGSGEGAALVSAATISSVNQTSLVDTSTPIHHTFSRERQPLRVYIISGGVPEIGRARSAMRWTHKPWSSHAQGHYTHRAREAGQDGRPLLHHEADRIMAH